MNTFFALMAEYGTAQIPIRNVCKLFGLGPEEAEKRAGKQQLPVPVYRLGSQKSPWLVDAAKLAEHVDKCKSRAESDWKKLQQVM
jgi:hypothetical protein